MPKQVPTVGDSIIYFPTEEEQQAMTDSPTCNPSSEMPATVTAAWGERTVNAKAIHDGDLADLWKTSIEQAPGAQVLTPVPGYWCWPWELGY